MTSSAEKINYGMFIMPFHPPEKPLSWCFDEDIETHPVHTPVAVWRAGHNSCRLRRSSICRFPYMCAVVKGAHALVPYLQSAARIQATYTP